MPKLPPAGDSCSFYGRKISAYDKQAIKKVKSVNYQGITTSHGKLLLIEK